MRKYSARLFVYWLALLSIALYVFFSDFLLATLGLLFLKPVFALGSFFFSGLYCIISANRIQQMAFLVVPVLLIGIYILFKNSAAISFFYTSVFGVLFIQNQNIAKKIFLFVFAAQFVLLFYEVLTQSLIYTTVTSGLFRVIEFEQNIEIYEESGFRAKGLFAGTLVAASFTIYFSFIFRNNIKLAFAAFIMALLVNGRMAILMTGIIFCINLYNYGLAHHVTARTIKVCFFFVLLLILAYIATKAQSSIRAEHLLNVFNFQSDDNSGRLYRYLTAVQEYFLNYSPLKKITGGEYELYDVYGRTVAAESELIGTLLEAGIIGFIWNATAFFLAWKSSDKALFSPKKVTDRLILLLTLLCIIEYRHLSGNLRGLMFWFILLTIINDAAHAVRTKTGRMKVKRKKEGLSNASTGRNIIPVPASSDCYRETAPC